MEGIKSLTYTSSVFKRVVLYVRKNLSVLGIILPCAAGAEFLVRDLYSESNNIGIYVGVSVAVLLIISNAIRYYSKHLLVEYFIRYQKRRSFKFAERRKFTPNKNIAKAIELCNSVREDSFRNGNYFQNDKITKLTVEFIISIAELNEQIEKADKNQKSILKNKKEILVKQFDLDLKLLESKIKLKR